MPMGLWAPKPMQEQVQLIIRARGLGPTAEFFEMSEAQLLRLAAGAGVRRGALALVQLGLMRLREPTSPTSGVTAKEYAAETGLNANTTRWHRALGLPARRPPAAPGLARQPRP